VEKLVLRDFQKEDILIMRQHNYNAFIANAPGTGKTIEVLAALTIDKDLLSPTLIICPASVTKNWELEAKKWCKWAKVHRIESRSDRLPKTPCQIYIISWALLQDRIIDLLRIRAKTIVADEAHLAKNEETKRSQVLYGLCQRSQHIMLLTGTPLINSYSEFESLNTLFGNRKPVVIRRLLEDAAPDIPLKTRMILPVTLPPSNRKEYQKAQEDFSDWLEQRLSQLFDDEEAAAAHRRALAAEALVKIGYLRRLVGRGKINAAVDWAARAVRVGEPVVIFAEHTDVIDEISHKLHKQRLRHVVIYGRTPKRKRQELVEMFQKGEIPIFIGSKAASTGITLVRARNLLFVERYWTSADEEQAEDRIRRIGQKYPTKMWYLHAQGTIDDRLARIILRKRRLMDEKFGLENIQDSTESTVMDLIRSWSEYSDAPMPKGSGSLLGLGNALPPLPRLTDTLQILFAGQRWNKPAVKAWMKMNGYKYKILKYDGKIWRATCNEHKVFMKGKFTTFSVSKEIKIVIGQRRKKKRGPKASNRGGKRIISRRLQQ
jgi:SNF2 family DNA or RNA helicase